MRLRHLAPAPLLALLLTAGPATAQDAPETQPRWTFGALAIHRDAPYRQIDDDPLLVPLVRFEGERAYLRGLRGGYVLHREDGFEFGPFLQVRGDGYDASDSPFLAGMRDRKFSLDAGVAASWRIPRVGQFELSLATDALDRSGGQEAEFSYTVLFKAAGWQVLPSLSVRWQSGDLLDYYYGVRADEALVGRPAYRADSAVSPELAVLATRPVGERWHLFARIGHTWLPSEVTDSPIVDADGRTTAIFGIGYSPGD